MRTSLNHAFLLRRELSILRSQLACLHLLKLEAKNNYNELEPRDEAGKWTFGLLAGQGLRTDAINTDISAARKTVTIECDNAMTGISTIDESTRSLCKTLGRTMTTMDFIPEWTPQAYGTAVHVSFGAEVRLGGFRGIGFSDVEHSFIDGRDAAYGEAGSIRTDVLLRNEIGDIIAVYDVKTGKGRLSQARVREIREHTGVQSNIPIIELHVIRGAWIKSRTAQIVGSVIAVLYKPMLS